MPPHWSLTHASYRAQAPSCSTWLSLMGGTGPVPSIVMTNENAWPARKSEEPEQVKPMSDWDRPTAALACSISGTMNSTSDSPEMEASWRWANDTTATSITAAEPSVRYREP